MAYGVKDPIDGAWLTAFYFVEDGPRKVNRGWEYTFDYPSDDSQPELDPERAYILSILAWLDDESYLFEAIIPMHESIPISQSTPKTALLVGSGAECIGGRRRRDFQCTMTLYSSSRAQVTPLRQRMMTPAGPIYISHRGSVHW